MSNPAKDQTPSKPQKAKQKQSSTAFYKFSGMAIKMATVILLGVMGGQYLDETLANQSPWMTIAGSLFGVAAAIYFVIRDTHS